MKKTQIILSAFLIYNVSFLSAQVNLDKGLLLHLKMDGNTADSSSNNYSVVNNSAQFTKDRFGNDSAALKFDGTNDYLTVKSLGKDMPKDSLTISLWLNAEETKGGNTFMLMPDNSSNRIAGSFFFQHNGKSAHFFDFGGISKRIFYEPDNAIQTWTFLIMTRSASELNLFKNGKVLQTVTNPSSYTPSNTDLRIGGGADGNFKGMIDDFRIYDRVLNAKEMDALYNQGMASSKTLNNQLINIYPNPFKQAFMIDYPMNEINSVKIVNSIGQNINYTFQNGMYTLEKNKSGLYIVEVNTVQGVFTKKILLIND